MWAKILKIQKSMSCHLWTARCCLIWNYMLSLPFLLFSNLFGFDIFEDYLCQIDDNIMIRSSKWAGKCFYFPTTWFWWQNHLFCYSQAINTIFVSQLGTTKSMTSMLNYHLFTGNSNGLRTSGALTFQYYHLFSFVADSWWAHGNGKCIYQSYFSLYIGVFIL